MDSTILMPQLGETVAEGKILAWFKSVGDEIKEGDNLFEVETDKVTIEVQAVVAGRLSEIRVGSGATAKVGEVLALVGKGEAAKEPARAEAPVTLAAPWRSPFEEVSTSPDKFGSAKGPNGVRVTPLARRLIAQHGLDLIVLVAEAERRGAKKIDEAAVRAAISSTRPSPCKERPGRDRPSPTPSPLPVQRGEVIKLNTVRQRDRGASRGKLADDSARVPGDRGRFHCGRSRAENAQGGNPNGARLLADVPAVHCAGGLSGDFRLSPGQRALRRKGAHAFARRKSWHRSRPRSQRPRRAGRA